MGPSPALNPVNPTTSDENLDCNPLRNEEGHNNSYCTYYFLTLGFRDRSQLRERFNFVISC